MSDNFNALVINQEGEKFSREIKKIDKSFLKHGDVLVKVDYSTLNFKDAKDSKLNKPVRASFLDWSISFDLSNS